jgi:hypothetical protein
MASHTVYTELGHAFGRGSPVRDYWLEHCDGFEAIGTDGRHLGRVRRFETPQGDAFLRLGGLRSRVVPVSAVERVWPRASLLVIADLDTSKNREERTASMSVSDPGLREGAQQRVTSFEPSSGRASDTHLATSTSRPGWEDETVPWWELVQENRAAGEVSEPPRFPSRVESPWTTTRRCFSGGGRAVRELSRRMSDDSQKLTRLLLRHVWNGWYVTRAGLRAVGKRCVAARAFGADLVRRERSVLGRLIVRLGVWVAGDGGRLGGAGDPPGPPAR